MPPKTKKRKSSGSVSEDAKKADSSTEEMATEETETKEEKENLTPNEKKLKNFAKYYKALGIVDTKEWETFLEYNLKPTPVSFRFLQSYRLLPSNPDTVPGIPSQLEVLSDYMKKKYYESLNKLVIEGKKEVKLEPLEWYPNETGWFLNVAQNEMEKLLSLKEFDNFLNTEKNMNTIQRLETWSMLPPLLLGIQPKHYVLDMCASPGFIAGQVTEIMHSDPSQAHEGLLVLNDLYKLTDKMQYRWTQGAKCVFTNNDARTYPEMYSSKDEQTPKTEIQYDRIICDVRCSNDGTMRKNTGIQDQWASKAALEYHIEQKKILKRAAELVKVRGLVLYCTASYNPVENEAVVMSVIKESEGTVELLDSRKQVKGGFKYRAGMTSWKVMTDEGMFFDKYEDTSEAFQAKYPASVFPPAAKEAKAFHMERCIRVLPHDNDTAGFFCAVLVKTSEVPTVKARRKTEMEAIISKTAEPKQYGYRIRLRCNVALTNIEWTTENTNEKLETKTTTEIEKFKAPPLEIDPHCLPQRLVDGSNEDVYRFVEPSFPEWEKIKGFFNISDDFDPTNMILRNHRSDFFMVAPTVKNLIQNNRARGVINFAPNVGVRVFHRMPRLWLPVTSTCNFMMTTMGLAYLHPYIGKQLVNITKDDMLHLAYSEKLKIDTLSELAQEELKETEQGCLLFQYKPEDSDAVPACNITFIGARGEKYITDFKDGISTLEKKTTFRMCGMEVDDYRRKLQEEKLAKALEREKEKEKEKEEKKKEEDEKGDAKMETA